MAINFNKVVRVRNYEDLPDNYRGPTGDFLSALQGIGDASGGVASFIFTAPAAMASKYVWQFTGLHVRRSVTVGTNFQIYVTQAGGESEYVSTAIVPGRSAYMIHSTAGEVQYWDANRQDWTNCFPITETQNGLTLVWTVNMCENANGIIYQASIWGRVFRRNVFRLGGPREPY